jgi:hypothetical protein
MKQILFLTAAFLFFAFNAVAADSPQYDKYLLRLPGQLLSLAEEDIDGDGDKDIVAFSLNADKRYAGRSVSVFYARRGAVSPVFDNPGAGPDAVLNIGTYRATRSPYV